MESFRRRRSHSHAAKVSSPANVTTIVDRCSGVTFSIPTDKARRGLPPIPEQQKLHKSSDGSGPCRSSITAGENLYSLESGQSSSRPPRGTLMKKLLADEMSKETESKRRSPSLIARLMGLDVLPPHHNANKQHKKLSESYKGNSKSHGSQSRKTRGKEPQQFKDVYEVGEGLKTETSSSTSRGTPNRQHGDDEMDYVRRKLSDVKRLSANERLKSSRGLDGALEHLVSNRDILVKLLDEPDSLFAKHLHDLQVSRQSHREQIHGVKSANALRHNIHAIGRHSGKEASRKIDISFSEKHDRSLYSKSYNRLAQDSKKSSPIQVDGKADMNATPTKIVVLKPNFAKVQDSAKSPSSCQDLLSDHKAHKECIYTHNAESFAYRKGFSTDLDNSGHKSRESRELAKEITERMRSTLGEGSFNVFLPGNRGYFADESSHDMSGNESSDESEMTKLTHRTPLHARSHNKSSASRHNNSHVNQEAKKRLSERWRTTNRSQEVVGKCSSTLGEMLAISDMDMQKGASDTSGQAGSFSRCNQNESIPGSASGISSKDGWKDICVGTLSRSKSLPISSRSVVSPRTGARNEGPGSERSLFPKEGMSCRRKEAINRYYHLKDESFIGNTRSDNMKDVASDHVDKEIIDVADIHFSQGPDIIHEAKDMSELKAVILESSSDTIDTGSTTDKIVDIEHPDTLDHVPKLNQTAEISANVLVEEQCSGTGLDESKPEELPNSSPAEVSACSQCRPIQPKSPASRKESDQPSPVSVLEALFAEDLSSGSECFERVSAELHGLRMQLRLLKQDSDSCDEGLGDEDGGGASTSFSYDKGLSSEEESWDSSYLVDVLTEAGFYNCDPETFMANWHFPECPVAPWIYDNLEKMYSEDTSCQRRDRRLLFDRINAGIIEFSHRFVDPYPWVGLHIKGSGRHQWPKEGLKAWMVDFLASQDEKSAICETDEMLLNEMKWIEVRDHIDIIGGDIEKLLIDELITELAKSCEEVNATDCKMKEMKWRELIDHIDSIESDIEHLLIDELVAKIAEP